MPQTVLGGAAANEDPNPGINENPAVGTPENPPAGNPAPSGNPPAFDFAKIVGENGALSENWRDALPESIRAEKSLDSIKTIQTLAQSYVHAQKSIGANKVAIPTENSTEDEWNAFYRACGRPEKVEDYKHDKVQLPEGIVLDETLLGNFRDFAFKHGLSQKAYEAALAFDVQRLQNQIDAANAAKDREFEETTQKLHTEYGDKFDAFIAQCNKAMNTFGLTKVLEEKGLLSNYSVIKALAAIGGKIGESKLKANEITPVADDLQGRIDAIRNNPEDPFFKKNHPAHNARVAEMANLLAAQSKVKK